MKNLAGFKIRGKHTTVIEPAYELVKIIRREECITGISFGDFLPQTTSRNKIKVETSKTRIRLEIAGKGHKQVINVLYCGDPELAEELIQGTWRELNPEPEKKSPKKKRDESKGRRLVRQACKTHHQTKRLHELTKDAEYLEADPTPIEPGPNALELIAFCHANELPEPIFTYTVRTKPNGKRRYSCNISIRLPNGNLSASCKMQSSKRQAQDLASSNALYKLS